MKCRHCQSELTLPMLDLGATPPSNAYLTKQSLQEAEKYFPLRVLVCTHCWLVQTDDYAKYDDLFNHEYAYFSSTSSSWVSHAEKYAEMIICDLQLDKNSLVIEVASNDGYMLKNFVAAKIPCLGIEPTASTADAAAKLGIPVLREFFGEKLGIQLSATNRLADLIIGNNVFAHVPDINDFTLGLKSALKQGGTITLEFPHLMKLLEFTQFDTVYHEHFSYLSLYSVNLILKASGLRIQNIEELPTHGGSLRIYACHSEDSRQTSQYVDEMLAEEERRGLQSAAVYSDFQAKVNRIKDDLLEFLIEKKREGKKVAAYGAAAKGNTLLNYAGVKSDLLAFVCDAAPAKQGKFLPGSRIPICAPSILQQQRPDYLIILPWNILDEIKNQNAELFELGTRFVTAIPNLKIE